MVYPAESTAPVLQLDVSNEGADTESTRRHRLGIVARAPAESVERCWSEVSRHPSFEWLRKPETGLVMVRGRIGGTGDPFNLGEMSVTRCAVRIRATSTGARVGVGYVSGRAPRHATIAALLDALAQDPERRAELEVRVFSPLERELAQRDQAEQGKAAATRVDFQTLVRGE